MANCAHPPSPLRISTTSSETRVQAAQGSVYGQRSPTGANGTRMGTRLRVKTNDFVLQPTHSYAHSYSPTKPVANSSPMSTSPTQLTATATSPPHSPSLDYRPATTTAATAGGSGRDTITSLRTSKPLGPRSSPRVGTSLSGRGDLDHLDRPHRPDRPDCPESAGVSGQKDGLRVEVEMDTDEGGEHEEKHEGGGAHLAPFRAPSSASVSTSFSASTHTSSKGGKRKSEVRRRGVAAGKEAGKYMQLEADDYERGHEASGERHGESGESGESGERHEEIREQR